jgi:hypothetical protein
MGKLSPATLLWPSSSLFASIMKIHDLTPSRKGKKIHFQELYSLGSWRKFQSHFLHENRQLRIAIETLSQKDMKFS